MICVERKNVGREHHSVVVENASCDHPLYEVICQALRECRKVAQPDLANAEAEFGRGQHAV